MEKTFFNNIKCYFFYIPFLLFVCNTFALLADQEFNYNGYEVKDDLEDNFNYELLGEFEILFRDVEEHLDEENCGSDAQFNIFKKWSKKSKKWFKEKVYNLFVKCVNLNKMRTLDDCAYSVADFKRKLDKIHKTGSIDKILNKFDDERPKDLGISDFREFKNKIKYYTNNKHAKPSNANCTSVFEINCRQSEYHGELDHIPVRAAIGGVMMGCGALISVLPLPGCPAVGGMIASTGFGMIVDAYVKKWEQEEISNLHHGINAFP